MMIERRHSPTEYRQAQLRARAREGQLEAIAARRIVNSMRSYADDLARLIRKMPRTQTRQTIRILRRTANQLERQLIAAVQNQRLLSFQEVQNIWTKAGLDAAKAGGVPNGLLGAVRRPPITLLGAYESVGSVNWKTLIRGYTRAGTQEVDQIVQRALLEGVSPEVLARRLRPYVQGSESFQKAFGGLGFDPRKLSDSRLRGAARRMNFNARRIATSEIHNARSEAEVQHFAADPMIRSVSWRLAPDRGPTARTDECDVFATSDFYGLGVGVYPVDSVPVTPHPFDRCERVPRVGGRSDVGKPKPIGLARKSAHRVGKCG